MAIVGTVALLVALVALCGYFLYRSIPGTGSASEGVNASGVAAEPVDTTETGALYSDVVGESTSVFVRVDQNKLWWIRGDETGSVDIWE